MSDDRGVSGRTLLVAFLAGAAAGAAVALLTSPKNGREMRETVGSWIRAAREAIDEKQAG